MQGTVLNACPKYDASGMPTSIKVAVAISNIKAAGHDVVTADSDAGEGITGFVLAQKGKVKTVAGVDVEIGELGDDGGINLLGLRALMVEHDRLVAVAADGEGAVLVLGGTNTEALGQATPPGPFLARSLVIRPRHDVGQALVGLERTGVVHLGANQDVLVREGEDGAAQLIGSLCACNCLYASYS